MVSPNLAIPALASNSDQPEVPVNAAIKALDESENDSVIHTITGDTVVTAADATENFMHFLEGSPSGAFNWTMPNAKKKFAVENNSGQIATIKAAGAGASIALSAGNRQLYWTDGSDIKAFAAAV